MQPAIFVGALALTLLNSTVSMAAQPQAQNGKTAECVAAEKIRQSDGSKRLRPSVVTCADQLNHNQSRVAITTRRGSPSERILAQKDWRASIDEKDGMESIPIDAALAGTNDVDGESAAENGGDEYQFVEMVDPAILRQELMVLIKLAVRDANEKRIGFVQNVIINDGAPHLLIVKLDNLIPSDRILRAIPSAEAVTAEDGANITLVTLKKSEVRNQSPFHHDDAIDTIVPLNNTTGSSEQKLKS